MREKIVDLLEKIDVAVAESEGVIGEAALVTISLLRNQIRTRLAYPDEVMVAGLVGGTGSGKSSILNAVAGDELVATGSLRPTTNAPAALVPARHSEAMSGYLDRLGIVDRYEYEKLPWLCLVDLPDTDTVHVDHLHTVEGLLPRLDLIIWVVDPEKYRDAAIHDHISALAEYSGQFVFVLNQIDRLPENAREMVESDLRVALEASGVTGPEVLAMAAQPVAGPPMGITELVGMLQQRFEVGSSLYRKLIVDTRRAASDLAGLSKGAGGLDFERRWAELRRSTSEAIEQGRAAEAAHMTAVLVGRLAAEVQDETEKALVRISRDVHSVIETATTAGTTQAAIDLVIATEIANPIRELLHKRAKSNAAIADLVLSAQGLG